MNKVEKIELGNGLRIYCYRSSRYFTSAAIFKINTGSFMENKRVDGGWSHLLEHMMFRSSKNYDARTKLSYFQHNGVCYNAYTKYDEIDFFFECPNSNFMKTFDVYLDMLFNPLFDSKELSTEQEVVISESKQLENKDSYKCFMDLINHGYSKKSKNTFFTNKPAGSVKCIRECNARRLRNMYEKYFDPRNIEIFIVCNTKNYGDLVNKIINLNLKQGKYDITQEAKRRMKIANSFNMVNGYGILIDDYRKNILMYLWKQGPSAKEYVKNPLLFNIAHVYKSYIGDGPNSVLWNKLREENGYIYSINMCSDINPYYSTNYITTEINPDHTSRFIDKYVEAMDDFTKTGIERETLKNLVRGIKNNYVFKKHDPLDFAEDMAYFSTVGAPIILEKEYIRNFNKVTPDDIMEYHLKYLADRSNGYITAMMHTRMKKEFEKAIYENRLVK